MVRSLTSPPRLGEPHALRGRLQLTAVSLGYVLLAVPALVLLCLLATALPLAAIGVGLVALLLLVPLNQQLADVHRRLSGAVLGREIRRSYRPTTGGTWWDRMVTWSRDVTRWRDFAWVWMSVCVGWTVAWLALGLALAVVWHAAFPLLYSLVPGGVVDVEYGAVVVDSTAESFVHWALLLVAVPVWWWGTPLLVRGRALLDEALLAPTRASLEARVTRVVESRAETVDHSAAEIRRIERDLHDGAQARLVSLGMSLGMAEQLLRDDPDRALALLGEARAAATSALGDLRSVVRGIHPPVLADRGLAGAVRALALDLAVPVSVQVDLPGRPPAPVESAAYFAVSECLANVVKHARAPRAAVAALWTDGVLRLQVSDEGRGGADPTAGSGLAGAERRLAAFDGTMVVHSPDGGPTTITMEIPCALSSPRTMPSSETV